MTIFFLHFFIVFKNWSSWNNCTKEDGSEYRYKNRTCLQYEDIFTVNKSYSIPTETTSNNCNGTDFETIGTLNIFLIRFSSI